MPLYIVRQDITKMSCDAIVNAANNTLLGGGGVDGAIHRAAGPELLKECKTLGGCETGKAKITKGYNLSCKYVIHTVGPIWDGGGSGEKEKLISCYRSSLLLAEEYKCESIAFPLISSGVYGYPKEEAFRVALDTVREYLETSDMSVYIVVFDKTAYSLSGKLFSDVKEYVDDNYVDVELHRHARRRAVPYGDRNGDDEADGCYYEASEFDSPFLFNCCAVDIDGHPLPKKTETESLEELLKNADDTFAVTLLKLIDKKGMTEVECYKRANVSKQTWYKIMNEKGYRPSKATVVAFAFSLSLTLAEAEQLLATVGFALSNSIKFDIIVRYFLEKGICDIFTVNEALFRFDQPCLGV